MSAMQTVIMAATKVPVRKRKKAVKWGAELSQPFEKPTPERKKQHDGVRKELIYKDPKDPAPCVTRYRARAECVLDSYLMRRMVSLDQHAAGVLFREAYLAAALRVQTRNFMMVAVDEGRSDTTGVSERASRARQRYSQAIKALSLEHQAVVIDVCGHDNTAGGTRKLDKLREALQILADLWRTSRDDEFLS